MNHELYKILKEIQNLLKEFQEFRQIFSFYLTNQRIFNTTHIHSSAGSPSVPLPTVELNLTNIETRLGELGVSINLINNEVNKIEREMRRNIEKLISQNKKNNENIKILSNVKSE